MNSTTSENNSYINNEFKYYIIIFLILILFIIIYRVSFREKEHMTGGTLTQLFANDSQDTYLKGNVDNLATGNFNLYWNDPTRVTGTFPNRGTLLPAVIMPQVNAIENHNDPNNLDIKLTDQKFKYKELEAHDNNSINSYLQTNCGEKCLTNPAACGNGEGGYRLGSDFVKPSTVKPFVSLQGNVYYPDQYVGQYWLQPTPDIMEPLPVVADGIPPLIPN
jgi:hypothetical protein